jgi:hypothetical protein
VTEAVQVQALICICFCDVGFRERKVLILRWDRAMWWYFLKSLTKLNLHCTINCSLWCCVWQPSEGLNFNQDSFTSGRSLSTSEILSVKWSLIFWEAEWFRKLCDTIKIFFELWLLNYVIFFFLTFSGRCIVIYSYNKNQQDALFLKFILIENSACFRQIYCPSSGVSTMYTQQ